MKPNQDIDQEILAKCQDINFITRYSYSLDDREFKVVKLRLGHQDGIKHTFKSISNFIPSRKGGYGGDRNLGDCPLCVNRVSQIFTKSIRKIKRCYERDLQNKDAS